MAVYSMPELIYVSHTALVLCRVRFIFYLNAWSLLSRGVEDGWIRGKAYLQMEQHRQWEWLFGGMLIASKYKGVVLEAKHILLTRDITHLRTAEHGAVLTSTLHNLD